MAKKSPRQKHKFGIADEEAVRVLVRKLCAPSGSRAVDEDRLLQALDRAAQQYKSSQHKVRQAFFHGLLTGYGVGLHRVGASETRRAAGR